MGNSIFPEMNLGVVKSITETAQKIGHFLNPLRGAEGYPSEYPKHPERGAAAMLGCLPPSINEPTDGEAYQPVIEGWDSLGTYIVKSEYEG